MSIAALLLSAADKDFCYRVQLSLSANLSTLSPSITHKENQNFSN